MKHKIDPTIDCVFKALLGSEENKDLLIYFLNAVINPSAENVIASLEILNPLNEDCSIHILELEKFLKKDVENELERWLLFFKEGKELDDESLPEYMKTEKMRIAMNTLITFSEKERQYHLYQSRMNYIREQKTIILDLEEALREKEAERLEKEKALLSIEAERLEKEKALELVEQLQEQIKALKKS